MAGRIAFLLGNLGGGGAERTMLLLAGRFAAAGHGVDLVLGRADGALASAVPDGVRVVDLGAARTRTLVPKLALWLRRERPGVLLSTTDAANLAAVAARALSGVPLRLVLRQSEAVAPSLRGATRWRDRWRLPLLRWLYPRADAIVAISHGVAEDLVATVGLPRDRVTVIHNPVDVARAAALAAEPPDHPWFAAGEPPVVLAVGRLVPQKDFATLLDAFARLRARRPARLVVLGEGPLRAALLAHAESLGVAADVAFPGFAANPFPAMARGGVFALSSRWEGFGVVLVEALACGCPVVSTDCPSGPAEILEDGRWGALVPVGDAARLAEALEAALAAALDDPGDADARRRRAADFAPERALPLYSAALGIEWVPRNSSNNAAQR